MLRLEAVAPVLDQLRDLSLLSIQGTILQVSGLALRGLLPPDGAMSMFSDKKSADPCVSILYIAIRLAICVTLPVRGNTLRVGRYVSFEGPLLHTQPAQPQTSVQHKTLNPVWNTTYRLHIGGLACPHIAFSCVHIANAWDLPRAAWL